MGGHLRGVLVQRCWIVTRRALLLFTCAIGLQAPAQADPRPKVQWARVALAGEFEQIPKVMPHVHALFARREFRERFQQRAHEAVAALASSHPSFDIAVNENLTQADDAYALSLVLAGEAVSLVGVEDVVDASYELQALVLIANVSKDPQKQRIVASYPVRLRHRTIFREGSQPTDDDARTIFRAMLLGEGAVGAADLVSLWQERLRRVTLRERDVWLSVAPIRFAPEALREANLDPAKAAEVSFRATSIIEANLSRTANIPIVPSGYDGALEQLTLNFADRGVVAFRNPDPSSVVDLTVYGLRAVRRQEAMTRETKFLVAHGGGFQLDYSQLDGDRQKTNEFSMRLKAVQIRSYSGASADARRVDDATAFAALIMNFAEQLSSSLTPADANWLEQAKADTETRSVQELVLLTRKLPMRRP